MKISINLLVVFFLVLLANKSYGQKFNAGIIGGLNFSELEGSELTDYIGLNLGLIGTMKLSRKHQMGIELLFSQNGEYIIPEYYPKVEYGKIRLNYIEVPIKVEDWTIATRIIYMIN